MYFIVVIGKAKQSPIKGRLLFGKTFCLKLIFALGIFFLSGAAFANNNPGDSLKGKYDINDPRNPDCPCHKYQRQADEEYRQLLNKENKIEGSLVANNPPSNNVISKRHYFSFSMFKLNLICKKNQKMRGAYKKEHRKKRKSLGKLARCFHFD